jgi:hypothetical protein
MDVVTHRAANGDRTVFNAKVDVFPKIGPNERYRSSCYDNLELRLVTNMSYRKTEEVMNRLRWQDDDDLIKSRTLADAVVREGARITDYMEAKAKQILIRHQFDEKSGKPKELHVLETDVECSKIPTFPADEVSKVIDEYNEGKEKDRQIDATQINEVFENPAYSVNISVDDVGVTEQKANRRCKDSGPKESKHYVQNTVIHIQQGLNKYILDGLGIRKTLILLTSFLLYNDLLTNKTLMFFTDGAVDIKNAIKDIYGWRPYQIILDWYHLKKKCKEQLSMALKGREIRNDVLKQVLALLWLGNVDTSIQYLRNLDKSKVRNAERIEKLIGYFNRNRDHIPCYALRKKLGLRISSNQGEKANDLVVAERQKHNGMSWSKPGSSGLANIRALFLNQEDENWIIRRELEFKLISSPRAKCA